MSLGIVAVDPAIVEGLGSLRTWSCWCHRSDTELQMRTDADRGGEHNRFATCFLDESDR